MVDLNSGFSYISASLHRVCSHLVFYGWLEFRF